MLPSVLRKGFVASFICVSLFTWGQSNTPKTLLWRISGKGLSHPSYLYGTMHLPDKRLFQFGDSLYAALQTTAGYAMEVNADEFLDSVFHNSLRDAEKDALLNSQKVQLNRRKLSREADSLLKSAGIRGDVTTKKNLKKLRDRRTQQLLQRGEMPTIMDAYLLGLARRLNKWTGGIEDVQDQLNLSDELGGGLEPETVLLPEATFQASIEQMTKMYLSQDLDLIDRMSNGSYNARDRDEMLIHRNIKMAFRMDSLSHERPTFFAVGAAHLPGDSGVITLLRGRGYFVEPVFSSATRFAGDFAATLPPAAWQAVEGEDKAYAVHMPGKPSDYNVFGNLLKMKMYFDMTTMTFYMAGSVSGGNINAEKLETMMQQSLQGITGKKSPVKTSNISMGALPGKTGTAENADGIFRLRLLQQANTVYMLMVGAVKKSNIGSPDVDRFFSSFVPGEIKSGGSQWETFALPDKGVSIRFPAKPARNEAIDKQVEADGNWKSVTYNAMDPQSGIFYLFQVRETSEGIYIQNDSVYLEQLQKEYQAKADKLLYLQKGEIEGYPAFDMKNFLKKADGVYYTRNIVRGSRAYSAVIGVPTGVDTAAATTFLQSLSILPYPTVALSTQSADGFATTAPARIKKLPADSLEKTSRPTANYFSKNAATGESFYVYRQVLSPTYWVSSDSSFFHAKLDQYKGVGDAVLQTAWAQNGNAKAVEGYIKVAGHNALRKLRFLVNADTLYTLYAMVPVQDTAREEYKAFFNDFRLLAEQKPTIYTPKTAALLQALQSGDSASFDDALENLSLVEFTAADLPLLQNALLHKYRDSTGYRSVGANLEDIVGRLADSTTTAFVAKHYNGAAAKEAGAQYHLLTVLAQAKTRASYALLRQLLLIDPPTAGTSGSLRSALSDSLALTATLFPALLQKADDSLLGYSLIVLANRLLDSSLLKAPDLSAFATPILAGAKRNAMQLDGEEAWSFVAWSSLLSQLNTPAGNAMLQKALSVNDLYTKQAVVMALLKNNLPVPATEIAKLAADKVQRGSFYNELTTLKKQALFPAAYATQASLAESEVYNILADEMEDFSLTPIGECVAMFEGKRGRFLLYRFRMADEEGGRKKPYLAVAGPYQVNTTDKVVWSKASGYFTNEVLTATNLNRLLKVYLDSMKTEEE